MPMLFRFVELTSLRMAMNLCHRLCCSSNRWAREVEERGLPWALAGVELGDNTLEIGPGYGAFLRVLMNKTAKLTAVEIDAAMAHRLQEQFGAGANIINGDGTDTGLPADEFSSVVSFTRCCTTSLPPSCRTGSLPRPSACFAPAVSLPAATGFRR